MPNQQQDTPDPSTADAATARRMIDEGIRKLTGYISRLVLALGLSYIFYAMHKNGRFSPDAQAFSYLAMLASNIAAFCFAKGGITQFRVSIFWKLVHAEAIAAGRLTPPTSADASSSTITRKA